jgi:hypothetical protein
MKRFALKRHMPGLSSDLEADLADLRGPLAALQSMLALSPPPDGLMLRGPLP